MIKTLIGGVFALAMTFSTAACAATSTPITYDLDPFDFVITGSVGNAFDGTYAVSGTIVTDGTLGSLDPSNFISGTATAVRKSQGLTFSFVIGASVLDGGTITMSNVTATASAKTINLTFLPDGHLTFSDGTNSFGFKQGSIIAFADIPSYGISVETQVSPANNAGIANRPLAQAPVPASLVLLASGFGALAFARRRKSIADIS